MPQVELGPEDRAAFERSLQYFDKAVDEFLGEN
jgi:hypothetical protein